MSPVLKQKVQVQGEVATLLFTSGGKITRDGPAFAAGPAVRPFP